MAQTRPVDVLLVEDDPASARRLRHHLRDVDAHIATADDGETGDGITHVETLEAAREALSTGEFDVLFLDLELPGSSGLATLDRAAELDPSLPVVVLTERTDPGHGDEAIRRGAQDFLVKGQIDGDLLSRSVRYAIERRRQTRELERQKEQMEFFNSVLRHDMLNGMNVIRMQAELLAEEVDGEELEYVETVIRWSDNIIDLTEKVRAVLDTLTDESETELHPVDLAPLLDAEAERVRGMDEDATVTVDVETDLTVVADDLLSDVLGNVLTNAVEHNDGGVTVRVTATEADDTVSVTVSDDGDGIPAADRDRLFERGETGTGSAGTGFGLYFVASMVETYGGEVRVTDSDAGGAEFVLELPAA